MGIGISKSLCRQMKSFADDYQENFRTQSLQSFVLYGNFVEGHRYALDLDDENAVQRVLKRYRSIPVVVRALYSVMRIAFVVCLIGTILSLFLYKEIFPIIGAAFVLSWIIRNIIRAYLRGCIRTAIYDYILEEDRRECQRIERNTDAYKFVQKSYLRNCPNCGANRMEDETHCKSCGTPLFV